MDLVPRPRPYLVSCPDPLTGRSGNETSPYADQTRDGTGACKGVAREAKPKASSVTVMAEGQQRSFTKNLSRQTALQIRQSTTATVKALAEQVR